MSVVIYPNQPQARTIPPSQVIWFAPKVQNFQSFTAALSFNQTLLPPFLDQMLCSGTTFSGVGSRGLLFDLDLGTRKNSSPIYETISRTISTSGITVFAAAFMVQARNLGIAGGGLTAIDLVVLYDGAKFTVSQFQKDSGGMRVVPHCSSGGGSSFGTPVPLTDGKSYWIMLFHDGGGYGQLMVVDAFTGAFVGVSKAASDSDTGLASFQIQDYLTFNNGKIWIDNFVLAFGSNATFPLGVPNFVLPATTSVTAVQTSTTVATITWAGGDYSAYNYQIDRRLSGTWTTLNSSLPNTPLSYTDSTVSVGNTYRYRITSKVNAYSSTATESNDLTIVSGAPNLIDEDFNATGVPTNWWSGTNANFDYSTSPLEGAQSLYLTGTTGNTSVNLQSDNAGLYIKFMLRVVGSLSGSPTIMEFLNNAESATPFTLLAQSNGSLTCDGGVSSSGAGTFANSTTYFVWIHFVQNTSVDVWWDTTDNFGTAGNHITYGATISNLNVPIGSIHPRGNVDTVFDKFQVGTNSFF